MLDNCHDVTDANFASILRIAAEQVPQDARLICISRAVPSAELARLEINARMLHHDWDELRLTLPEARQIVAASTTSAHSDAENLFQRSDGWVAGLTLLLSGDDAQMSTPKAAEPKSREALFRYFAGEVFAEAPEETREQLMRVALFPQFSLSMATQISDNEQAGQILDDLHRKQYFTYRNVEVEPGYQFHDLFREFLLARLAETRTKNELQALQRKAAQLMEDAGQPEAAVELYRAVQAWKSITKLILQHAEALVDHGRWQTVNDWLVGIPTEAIENEPWLAYWLAVGQIPLDPPRAQELLEQVYVDFGRTADTRGRYWWPAVRSRSRSTLTTCFTRSITGYPSWRREWVTLW